MQLPLIGISCFGLLGLAAIGTRLDAQRQLDCRLSWLLRMN